MKALLHFFSLTLVLVAVTTSHAAPIPKLFNTGVDDTGKVLAANTVDPHYKIVEIPDGMTVSNDAFTLRVGFPVPPWIAESTISRWIAPKGDQSAGSAAGNYIYRTTFDLTGFDASKASITGRWVSDNGGVDVVLNGNSLGLSNTTAGVRLFSTRTLTAPNWTAIAEQVVTTGDSSSAKIQATDAARFFRLQR